MAQCWTRELLTDWCIRCAEEGGLTATQEDLLQQVAEGKTINAIAAQRKTTPASVNASIEDLFVALAEGLTAGNSESLQRLRTLQKAIVDRKEQGESLSRLLPGGVAAQIIEEGRLPGETEELMVTVLMSDVRGYTTIAEHADPSALAGQLNQHRAAMNDAILGLGGTVMQFVGDAVMAVFGAPVSRPDHADVAAAAAMAMHSAQEGLNQGWAAAGLHEFGLGIGLSTGKVAAALLGSAERLEYTLVGDTVNLTQRLQGWAEPGETVMSQATWDALQARPPADELVPALVKGRETPVSGYRFPPRQT